MVDIDLTWDPEEDVAYMRLQPKYLGLRPAYQVVVTDTGTPYEVNLDIGHDGRILGIEVVGAEAAFGPLYIPPPFKRIFRSIQGDEKTESRLDGAG